MPLLTSAVIASAVVACVSPASVQVSELPRVPFALQAASTPPPVPPAPPVPAAPAAQTPPAPPTPPAAPQAPAPPTPPAAPQAPAPPPARVPRVPVPPPPPAKPGQNVNVQVELTIKETPSTLPAETKVVSLVASDATWGRVRSRGVSRPTPEVPPNAVELNVDARPTLLSNGAIRLELTLDYAPVIEASEAVAQPAPSRLSQTVNVILKSGVSMLLTQAVDPVSNRRTTVEVKATRLP